MIKLSPPRHRAESVLAVFGQAVFGRESQKAAVRGKYLRWKRPIAGIHGILTTSAYILPQ
jgi:hypothetical protein